MRSGRFRHRVDRYAEAVLDGGTVAGPLVRLACERHFRDREEGAAGGWYQFSEARADHLLDFFESCLRLPDAVDAEGEPQPFLLSVGSGFWSFILGSLFGWVDDAGYRRFREGYIEAGKGSAKTPVLAGVGLYGLMMDGERAAEIYAAAADQDQAMIMFRDAVRIGKVSPDVRDELEFDGGVHIWQIRHPESMSFFRTFSREGGQKSGPRPHMGLIDELHEQPSPEVSVKVRAGAKRRPQPMFLEITNSGFDRTSICWQRHEHARKIVERVVEDDQLFAYVCALDEGDDPLVDESCWPKTNPYIGISVTEDYLRRQVQNAKNIQAETNNVLRLNFCVWTQAYSRAIDMRQWFECEPMPSDADLAKAECFGSLDLGQSDDFSAWCRMWILADGRVAVKMRYFLPRAALERYPDRPYAEWERAGLLEITDGDTTDYEVIRGRIRADALESSVGTIYYDKRFTTETAQILDGEGFDMAHIAQGFGLNEAIKRFLELVATGMLCHGDDPILAWMASNLVLLTGRIDGQRRIDKDRAPDKIDGIAALVMGIEGALVRRERVPEPTYQFMVFGGRRR